MSSAGTTLLDLSKPTNPEGFTVVVADKLSPMRDLILIQWQEKQDLIKVGSKRLLRPETHKKAHYTGVILKMGPHVGLDLKVGDRIFFEQFAGFEKFFDHKYGRLALIRQSDAYAVIPKRTEIESDGGEYDFNQ